MSWIGGSLSSLTGQLSNLTKDILTEGTEEVGDPTTELRIAKEKIQQLDSLLTAQRQENERLKHINKELEEKAESAELQINTISRQYRGVLESKEKEVNTLKQQHQDLLEQHARTAALSLSSADATPSSTSSSSSSAQHGGSQAHSWASPALGGQEFASFNYDGDPGDWDFDDSIRLQRENNNLRVELQRLQTEVKHWRSVAGQLGQNAGQSSDQQTASADVLELQHKVKNLETELAKRKDELQQQATSLHEHHRQKVSTLKSQHKKDIDSLHQKLSALEQELRDAHDGINTPQPSDSSGSQESEKEAELQKRLSEALHEKEKAQDARSHLEGVLEELQQEVQLLQQQLEEQQQNEAGGDQQKEITELRQRLQESEALRVDLEREVEEVREELKKQVTQSLHEVKEEQEGVLAEAEEAIEKIGDTQQQNVTAKLFDTLEKENLLLKEEKLKLEEQISLLEKAASTVTEEKQTLQTRVKTLQTQLHSFTGGGGADSDDTYDDDLSSDLSASAANSKNAALYVGKEAVEKELASLRAQLSKQEADVSDVEMERADWSMEREALEDVITELREKTQIQEEEILSLKSSASVSTSGEVVSTESSEKFQNLQEEVSSLKEEKAELENALEELDQQHSLALEQLIKQRDQLASQVGQRNDEIQQQQEQIDKLNEEITQLRESSEDLVDSPDDDRESGRQQQQQRQQQLEERCKQLEAELTSARKATGSSGAVEKEVAELKEKLHKGGLVINDLHMDKQELQGELKSAKEETAAKVVKLKEMREENVKLGKEKKDLEGKILEMEDRLVEMEEEVEKWQQINEEKQVQQRGAAEEHEQCEKFKTQLAAMEKEKQQFKTNFEHLTAEHSDVEFPFEDSGLTKILEEEARVRKQIEADGCLIRDLKQQVQKLYDEKQTLKSELKALKDSQESNSAEKLALLEKELQETRSALETARQQKVEVERKLAEEIENGKGLRLQLSEADVKLSEAGRQNEELSNELAILQREKSDLANQLESQQKHYDAYIQELKSGQELGEESLQAEHQRLLDSQKELSLEVDRMQGLAKEKAELETSLAAKKQEIENLNSKVASFRQEIASIHGEISRLEGLCVKKDEEIEELKSRMSQFDTDLAEIEESVSEAEQKHSLEMSGKEEELKELRNRNVGLERSLSQVQVELETVSSDKHAQQGSQGVGASPSDDVTQLQREIDRLKSEMSDSQHQQETITQLEVELSLCNETIAKLHQDLAAAQDTIKCHEAGIVDLNEKADEQRRNLEHAEQDVTRQKSTIAVLRQSSMDRDALMKEIEAKLNFLVTILSPQQIEQLKNFSQNFSQVPALEYQDPKAIEYSGQSGTEDSVVVEIMESQVYHPLQSDSQTSATANTEKDVNGYIIEEDFDSSTSDRDRFIALEKEMDDLRARLSEKDSIVAELQKSNSSLLALLEKGGGGVDRNLSSQVATHKLEAELRNLKAEREQMVAIVTEKSRENSSLKGEVHRLMEVVAAGQRALDKLQEDNRNLDQRQHSPPRDDGDDDMRREALTNMARLVRDRETEIEALKQKNETLLAVLQESGESQAAAHLAPLLRDKEVLTQQVTELTTEREQLIACVTQKHSESLAYHAEVQRLTALLAEAQETGEKAKKEYSAIIPAFEDKSQALIAAQNELVKCKQKLSDLEVRHGELIQRSSSQDSSSTPQLSSLEDELERLKRADFELRTLLSERDEKIHSLSHRISTLEEELTVKENEIAHLRKQAENSKFQLTGLMAEMADMRAEREQIQQKTSAQDSESATLREAFNKMSMEAGQKDIELASLKEQITTLTSLLNEQQGEQGQVSRLMKDNEAALASARQLQQERDQHAMIAEQRLQESHGLRTEIAHLKEKEFKLTRELERLRGHLIEIEEGYTKEALESEEREKELRNRLAVAEEQVMSSSSKVELASKETSHKIESLEQELHHVAGQRDSAYMQVANTQEQCQQYATSLSNLQLVLEHFQKEKDSAIASETERLQNECKILKIEVKEMQQELEATRGDLSEALDGLEAANRLSEQLDRKEEALAALKEEVQLREEALNTAEEEIRKLSSSTEAKVDKTLMHNMVMTWLTSPENKRMEIVHLIGNILSFSQDDFRKIEAIHGKGGLLSGIFRRTSTSSPQSSPRRETPFDQSFSQLFVKFLEKESSPPPTPVRLPAEAMAAETQHKHKPAFNPFTAPRHVTHDGQRSATPTSHILMSPESPAPTPLFTPLTSMPNASAESAILKDVLGKR